MFFAVHPGGPKEDRTPDLCIANAALSQLSYRPMAKSVASRELGRTGKPTMTYSVEFCEKQYNNRLLVPEHAQIFQRWSALGKAFRDEREADAGTFLHRAYGQGDRERLDYFHCGVEGAPLLVFIHGGYWRSLDKHDFSWVAKPFLEAHIDVAVVNYGLCPEVQIDDIVRQMYKACTWLYRNADSLGFDRELLCVAGHSAGAHLAAMLLCAQWPSWGPDLPPDLVKAGILLSGLYDLEPLLYAPFVNGDLRLDADAVKRLSPVQMKPQTLSAVVTAVGALESAEFIRQNGLIEAHWQDNFRRDVPMPGTNHFTVVDALADATNPLTRAAIELCLRPYVDPHG